jgi:triosephosphate isomerase (TIM)
MKKLLIANWKMKLKESDSIDLAKKYIEKLNKSRNVEVIIAPTMLYLSKIASLLKKSNLKLASQNIAVMESGALTGETSAEMVHEAGCKYTLVGHSERRHKMHETDDEINKKINLAYDNGLIPVLCIGETLKDKNDGQRDTVLTIQLRNALSKVDNLPDKQLIIAYEPVWAISSSGSGLLMEAEEMYTVARIVKRVLSSLYSESFYEEKVKLLYGGSINSIIAKDFWNIEILDGLLVGSASLDAQEMSTIALQSE